MENKSGKAREFPPLHFVDLTKGLHWCACMVNHNHECVLGASSSFEGQLSNGERHF